MRNTWQHLPPVAVLQTVWVCEVTARSLPSVPGHADGSHQWWANGTSVILYLQMLQQLFKQYIH